MGARRSPGIGAPEVDLDFLTANEGWMMVIGRGTMGRQPGYLFQTTTGGTSWQLISETDGQSVPQPNPSLTTIPFGMEGKGDILFTSAKTGWMPCVTYASSICLFGTSDGGRTWQSQQIAQAPCMNTKVQSALPSRPQFFSPNTVLLPIAAGCQVVYVTSDDGKTWTSGRAIGTPGKTMTDFVSATVAVGGGYGKRSAFATTSDAGAHWKVVSTDLAPFTSKQTLPLALNFISPLRWWLVTATPTASGGGKTSLYHTDNGGLTWTPAPA